MVLVQGAWLNAHGSWPQAPGMERDPGSTWTVDLAAPRAINLEPSAQAHCTFRSGPLHFPLKSTHLALKPHASSAYVPCTFRSSPLHLLLKSIVSDIHLAPVFIFAVATGLKFTHQEPPN